LEGEEVRLSLTKDRKSDKTWENGRSEIQLAAVWQGHRTADSDKMMS